MTEGFNYKIEDIVNIKLLECDNTDPHFMVYMFEINSDSIGISYSKFYGLLSTLGIKNPNIKHFYHNTVLLMYPTDDTQIKINFYFGKNIKKITLNEVERCKIAKVIFEFNKKQK